MSQGEALRRVLALLESLGTEYMLTGSYASNIYGRVRSTFDADLVVALTAAQMGRLRRLFGPDFYVDAENLKEVRELGGQFNALHHPSGLKIDFYLPRDGHDRQALQRRRFVELWGVRIPVVSPEDLILAKLRWAKAGGSARQAEDARGVYELQRDTLDLGYLRSKADELALRDSLEAILK